MSLNRRLVEEDETYHLVTLGCPKNEVDSDGMECCCGRPTLASAPMRAGRMC